MSDLRPRILVIGAGHLGSYHLDKIAACERAELVGVVDPHAAHLQRAQAKHGIPGSHSLEYFRGKVDAAIVASPTASHLELGRAVLHEGWHLLMEKPLAATAHEAQQLVALARQKERLLQVGHVERFNPAVAAALAVADSPRYIVAERLGPFSGRSSDVDVVLDLMIHDLDIVASLVQAPLHDVRAVGVAVLTQAVDMASARLEFADGTVAQLSAGRASLEPARKLRLFTVQRYISIDCATREVKSVRRLPAQANSPWPQITGEMLDIPAGDALALQSEDFIDCIITGRTPRVDGAAGLRALQLAEAVKAAMSMPVSGEDMARYGGLNAGDPATP